MPPTSLLARFQTAPQYSPYFVDLTWHSSDAKFYILAYKDTSDATNLWEAVEQVLSERNVLKYYS